MPDENLPQSDIDALLAIMKREAIKQRRFNRFRLWCVSVYICFFLVGLIFMFTFKSHVGSWFPILNIFNFLPQIIASGINSKRRKKTVEALAKSNDVRIVGPLCDTLSFRDAEMAKIAQETLIKILPRLQASDAHLLNREQRDRLYGTLTSGNKPLTLATLKALEQIGDEKAIPEVEKLANGTRFANIEENEIRDAANHCLPFLRERAAAQKAGQELLRASGLNMNTADLLRPTSSQATEPQELLRASVNGGDSGV